MTDHGKMIRISTDALNALSDKIEQYEKMIVPELGRQLQSADLAIKTLVEQKDNAYTERNYLVAVISKIWPAHIIKDQYEDGTEWSDIICVHIAGRHCGWHIHDSERQMFYHLKSSPIPDHDYDGMTTAEKYSVLSMLPVTWPHG